MEESFSCLLIEPAIPAHIFSYLPLHDLCSVELVCHAWRDVVKEFSYWKHMLTRLYSSDVTWRSRLSRLSWKDSDLTHSTCKGLYMKIASELGPVCGDFTSRMLQGDFTRADCESIVCTTLEEKLFLKGFYSNRRQIFDMVEKCDTDTFSNRCRFSPLILTGPSAFPIVVSDHSGEDCVLVAGATYGKGRVVVLGHEALCSTHNMCAQMVLYLADWCGRRANCPIAKDSGGMRPPVVGSLGSCLSTPPLRPLTRKQLSANDVPVFITGGHYDDDADFVLEYVREGGGLIIGGHAWKWTEEQTNHCRDLLQQHPGNRITSHMGIVFSHYSCQDPNLHVSRGVVPGLRHSLYYVLKWGRDGDDSLMVYPIIQQMRDWLENWWQEVKDDQFEDIDNVITNYMNKYNDDDYDPNDPNDPNADFLLGPLPH